MPDVLVSVRAQRAFLGRAVHYLVAEAGIGQFLDIGTGLPAASNTHEVAQRAAPESRVVYVDNDPIVLAARPGPAGQQPAGHDRLHPGGSARHRDDPGPRRPRAGFRASRSRCCCCGCCTLHPGPRTIRPAIVARLMAAVPAGSYLAIAHPASDVATEQMTRVHGRVQQAGGLPWSPPAATPGSAGSSPDLVEPGVVQLHRWRPGTAEVGQGRELANYGGVGRKP